MNVDNCGKVYIYERSGLQWLEPPISITAQEPEKDDMFGKSVCIDGDYIIVGAPGMKDGGAAFIYKRTSKEWELDGELSQPLASGNFGHSVSISGTRVIIGSTAAHNNGLVYIYERKANKWDKIKTLMTTDSDVDDYGHSVSISGDSAIVGVSKGDRVYFYYYDGQTWPLEQRSNYVDGTDFGRSVSVSGNFAVVGAVLDDTNGVDQGAAIIYMRLDTGGWAQFDELYPSDGTTNDMFGYSVSISGEHIISSTSTRMKSYIFKLEDNNWIEKSILFDPGLHGLDYFHGFGFSVSIDETPDGVYAVSGAPYYGKRSVWGGAIFVYRIWILSDIFLDILKVIRDMIEIIIDLFPPVGHLSQLLEFV
jgi:hypothetical protein